MPEHVLEPLDRERERLLHLEGGWAERRGEHMHARVLLDRERERLLHLRDSMKPVGKGEEGVGQRAVDAHLARHAEPADASVEVDRVVEARVEAAHLMRVVISDEAGNQ